MIHQTKELLNDMDDTDTTIDYYMHGFKNRTGPDRPVQPWTGLYTCPIMWKIRKFNKNQEKPVTGGLIGITGDRNDRTDYEADRNERENITPAAHEFGFLFIPTSRRCSPTTLALRRCLSITPTSHRRRISAKHQIRSSLSPPLLVDNPFWVFAAASSSGFVPDLRVCLCPFVFSQFLPFYFFFSVSFFVLYFLYFFSFCLFTAWPQYLHVKIFSSIQLFLSFLFFN